MERRMIKSMVLIVLTLLFSAGFAFAAEPVKVGVVYPLTGPIAATGKYMVAGVEIARDKINAEGGILGREVKLFVEDGANDPAQSVSAAEKLVTREKIDMLLVEQNADLALQIADRAYLLETGSLVMEGPAHELLENKHVQKAYLGG